MMPGTHIPPAVPMHQGRRQGEHQHHYQYQYPPQTHSPVHNPYAQPYHPHHYGAPHAAPYPPQMMPQWYNPYQLPQHQQHQYPVPQRPYQPHGSPVVVSSQPHMAPMPVNRSTAQTPPIVHSRTPPVARQQTPQPAPSTPSASSYWHRAFTPSLASSTHVASTPSVASQPYVSSPTPPLDRSVATDMTTPTPPPATPSLPPVAAPVQAAPPTHKPFYPNLPWYSVPGQPFPPRASHKKRRRPPLAMSDEVLAFPAREPAADEPATADKTVQETETSKEDSVIGSDKTPVEETDESQASTIAGVSEAETPSTSHPPSEADSTHPTTPSSTRPAPQPAIAPSSSRPAGATHTRTATIPAVPLIPIRSAKPPSVASATKRSVKSVVDNTQPMQIPTSPTTPAELTANAEETPKASPPPRKPPASWAALLQPATKAPAQVQAPTNTNGAAPANGSATPKSTSLADLLASYSVHSERKLSFLEPRGLVNTGNMCYMNSILQVLLFCVPFYDFLDQVIKRTTLSLKGDTPLINAMIEYLRDFKVIDSAVSVEQLRMRLKDNELEQYGDPMTPEYVYDTIKKLPRFDNMKRGQQEDAEEFLGFLLAGLHDECATIIKAGRRPSAAVTSVTSSRSERSASIDAGWSEVGPKQKASVTQSSGTIEIESPITKIFGGKIRSQYHKPGEKLSVTYEPYQPLQLDIGSPHVTNISGALKHMTHLETLESATRGGRSATKQIFLDTVPPVLILHLKRFFYDASGAQKIWKKVGYPLEWQLPKEVFTKSSALFREPPRYRLTAAVYHHGKNASGGHYTVDLRRQDDREWVRLDDTVIRRVRAEDIAEGGAEEDPKVLAAALEQHKQDAGNGRSRNFYDVMAEDDEEKKDEGGWSKVNGMDKTGKDGAKKWSGVVNGTATPSSAGKRTPLPKENVKDNKVAYILFYQRIEV